MVVAVDRLELPADLAVDLEVGVAGVRLACRQPFADDPLPTDDPEQTRLGTTLTGGRHGPSPERGRAERPVENGRLTGRDPFAAAVEQFVVDGHGLAVGVRRLRKQLLADHVRPEHGRVEVRGDRARDGGLADARRPTDDHQRRVVAGHDPADTCHTTGAGSAVCLRRRGPPTRAVVGRFVSVGATPTRPVSLCHRHSPRTPPSISTVWSTRELSRHRAVRWTVAGPWATLAAS